MQITNAENELLDRLEAAGLNPLALEPWESWKVFKTYLQTEFLKAHLETEIAGDIYDAASVQFDRSRVYFVRQFSQWFNNKDVGILQVLVALTFDRTGRPFQEAEFWSHDFPTLAEFASVVESDAQFQAAINSTVLRSQVYAEQL
jgi:hypothetical protein